MRQDRAIWIVIPSYNEASVLAATIADIRSHFPPANVLVVDDGSTDDTPEVLEALAVLFLRHKVNCGQGAALRTGIDAALKRGAEYIVTFDADGQHSASEIEKIIFPLIEGRFDVSLGSRFMRHEDTRAVPRSRRVLLQLATWFTRCTTRLHLTDTHNGFRGFSRKAAETLELKQNRMAHASEILYQIRQAGLRYCEVPVSIRYTEYSRAKGQKFWSLFQVLWDMANYSGLVTTVKTIQSPNKAARSNIFKA